ncbi:patatin-like phospholipase family protein [Phycicoccus sp. CSK15P-2]|uniref:patatin-like phospholipase family protein n=1 Tax=Phycicoccus sp. CSK15P-2 TaxID=2807627 RepID=UPI00195240B0|nr:patatin-like phospholipase family protein [Phycicoccus sp. CSK15P-2]MBM6405373.1 patatin-like phospholipase family protein [Phycicoccus sp. CSK15P-2]
MDRPVPADPATQRVALVLEAGGARSAYQVGALEVLLPRLAEAGAQPRLVVGTSAGALLAAACAATAHLDAEEQTARLLGVLGQATKRGVMRPLWRHSPSVALRYASETLGISRFRLRGLVGTQPLHRTLRTALDWDAVHRNIEDGRLDAVAITATAVRTGRVVLFTEAAPGFGDLPRPPREHHRHYAPTRLGVEHLMASSAIPALFPSVRVEEPASAAGWYVDGATRRRVPLAPGLELGGERLVVVGTGSLHPAPADTERDREDVDIGDGGATLLGAVMDDPLRHDLRRLAEVNDLAADEAVLRALDRRRHEEGRPGHRAVPYVAVAPERGEELAALAMEVFRANHGSWLHTLGDPDLQLVHRLLGSDSPLQGELLSYLMFDPDFFDGAADLGRRDARQWLRREPQLWRTGPMPAPEEAGPAS